MSRRLFSKSGIVFLKLLARFPFWALYRLSDVFFIVVYYIIGYRKSIVLENLQNSFPEKEHKEIKRISGKFYRHFSDLTLEVIKMAGMKEKDFRKRMIINNADTLNRFYNKGKSVVVLTMHFNNWEWGSSFPLFIQHKILGVYKPLHNTYYDVYINKNRSLMGAELVPNSNILRRVLNAKKKKEPVFIWLAGDQTPPHFHKFWLKFLNQEAIFYQGPAAISRQFNYPVFFQKTLKKSRGIYETTFELLFENPENHSETEIMKAYIQKMEETILEQPEFYLWSHRRWKHRRPADIPLQE